MIWSLLYIAGLLFLIGDNIATGLLFLGIVGACQWVCSRGKQEA